jgi:hypothetical protein
VVVELEEQAIGGITIMPKPEYASFYEVGTLDVQLVDTIETKILWEGSRSMVLWKKKAPGRSLQELFLSQVAAC